MQGTFRSESRRVLSETANVFTVFCTVYVGAIVDVDVANDQTTDYRLTQMTQTLYSILQRQFWVLPTLAMTLTKETGGNLVGPFSRSCSR